MGGVFGWRRRRVVTARRFDAVDSHGRVRVSVGVFSEGGDDATAGVDVFDSVGRSRASLVVDEGGVATLSFAAAGNEVLVVGAREQGEPADGAFVVFCSLDGDPAASVAVDEGGSVVVRRHGEAGF